ncbi:MAG: FAD binding domain-containing protein [Spirochaetaceae bacterium]|jgi:carbon-monoxide dehydrogenase medium subunit|nr:FAD binding domain-containing protein [Spirochaetaceae bacterium]
MNTPHMPESLSGLLVLLAGHNGPCVLVAGGTDVLAKLSRGITHDPQINPSIIDISRVNEMRGIALRDDTLRIGALETMTAIAENALVIKYAACLATAAACLGSWQIRNRATIGGNIANASPAADTPPALAALDALALAVSPRGSREVPVSGAFAAANRSVLEKDEVIAELCIPLTPRRISAFGKIGSRREVSIARLNLAVAISAETLSPASARVFAGTLGKAVLRCPGAEAALQGPESLDSVRDAFCAALADAVENAIPGRSTLPYKRSAIQALGEDVLAMLDRAIRPPAEAPNG